MTRECLKCAMTALSMEVVINISLHVLSFISLVWKHCYITVIICCLIWLALEHAFTRESFVLAQSPAGPVDDSLCRLWLLGHMSRSRSPYFSDSVFSPCSSKKRLLSYLQAQRAALREGLTLRDALVGSSASLSCHLASTAAGWRGTEESYRKESLLCRTLRCCPEEKACSV